MTSAQVNILINDRDLIPGDGMIHIQNKYFEAGKDLKNALQQIFEGYLHEIVYGDEWHGGTSEDCISRVESRMREIYITNEQKINFLNIQVHNEGRGLDMVRQKYAWEISIKDIKDSWFLGLLDDIENLIECLKFKILSGDKLKDFQFQTIRSLPNFDLLNEYFLSDKMKEIYSAAGIEENIKFLQKTISGLPSGVKNSPFSKKDITVDQEGINALTHGAVSILCVYRGINVNYESLVEKEMTTLGITNPISPSMKKSIVNGFKKFIDEKIVLHDSTTQFNKRIWGDRLKKIKSVLPFLDITQMVEANKDIDIIEKRWKK